MPPTPFAVLLTLAGLVPLQVSPPADLQDGPRGRPQDAPPLLPPELPAGEVPPQLLAADGKPVVPGRVPAGTSEEALRHWNRLLATVAGGGNALRPPLTDFDLAVDVVRRQGPDKPVNDSEAGFRFLESPRGSYLRVYLERKDLVVLRGPRGDYLIDDDEVRDLAGRDGAEDRRLLDEYARLCRIFVSLARPDQLRLVRIETRDVATPPEQGPLSIWFGEDANTLSFPDVDLAEEARGLAWLYVESPDFHLVAGRTSAAVPRALLGLEPDSGEVRLVVLAEDEGDPLMASGSVLVLLGGLIELEGGWRVPRSLIVKPVDVTGQPPRFARLEDTEIWLKRKDSKLNPGLTPRDFLPPR